MYNDLFQKQPMMRKVIYSLLPIYLFAGYMYGWRLLFLTGIVFSAGIVTEYIFEKLRKKKVTEAVLVTCMLYLLSLPPLTPWWIALIGIVFGVIFGKMVFGGFGRNTYNPAITGRLFVYISFPNRMTYDWSTFGNFGIGMDALSGATPLSILREGGSIDIVQHLLGFRPGSMGESPIILIVLAGIYLIWTKTASWEIITGYFTSAMLLSLGLYLFDAPYAMEPVSAMISGSVLFVLVFMATDPISAPKRTPSKWVYGIVIGMTTVIIRTFSLFPEGTSFGILLGNTFAPLLDEIFTRKKA